MLVNLNISIFILVINTCKESGIWVPDTSGMIPGVGIGVPENISSRILDRHLDDLWIGIPDFFRSGIYGYPYSHSYKYPPTFKAHFNLFVMKEKCQFCETLQLFMHRTNKRIQ